MSRIAQKISGCYRRVLIFIFAILIVSIGIGLFAYNRVGGAEGMRYWMAKRALNSTEKLLIKNLPPTDTDTSPETVEGKFQNVRDAIGNRQIDLISLYDLLNSFQTKFRSSGLSTENIKLSTSKVMEFLTQLEKTIIREE